MAKPIERCETCAFCDADTMTCRYCPPNITNTWDATQPVSLYPKVTPDLGCSKFATKL